jgi:glycosyltransferase involved in cell wall biosynthesis
VYIPISQNTWGFFRDGLFVLIGRWFSKARTVIHYHGGESFLDFWRNANSIMKWYIPFVLERVDVAIVLGKRLQDIFKSTVARVETVPNGITFNPTLRAHRGNHGGVVYISYLGGLFKAKGVVDLVRAAALVLKKRSTAHFRFAGEWWVQEPETKREVKQILQNSDISSHVSFVGRILGEQKELYLLDTDIFVLPSWSEGFPLVILEAMAAGCPVISTRVGAIPEVVLEGITGILVEKQNPQQLADAIIRLVDDPELRQRMGEAGRKRFEEHYTFERCAERLIKVFEQVLQERSVV